MIGGVAAFENKIHLFDVGEGVEPRRREGRQWDPDFPPGVGHGPGRVVQIHDPFAGGVGQFDFRVFHAAGRAAHPEHEGFVQREVPGGRARGQLVPKTVPRRRGQIVLHLQ